MTTPAPPTDEPVSAYKNIRPGPHPDMELPGKEAEMDPMAEWTRLEHWDEDGKPYLKEYEGVGKLKGKSALITGGDSGIGRSAAIMFAREGADVSIVYQPEEQEDGEAVKRAVEEAGRVCLLLPGDLMDGEFCKEAVKKHVDRFGSINVLVNNAAKQGYSEFIGDLDLEFAESTFRSNILSFFAVTKAAVHHMPRGSSIINSTSVGAYNGHSMKIKLDYSSTKGAIVSFTRSLAIQLAPRNIRVNAVAPGPIWTPLNPATRNAPADAVEDIAYKEVPLKRVGQPAELGPSYVFLASADASYITGQVIHVNGGMWTGS